MYKLRNGSLAPLNNRVSAQMKKMPTRDLKPEVLIRQQLHRLGLRYRIHRKDLLGKPDITFRPSKVAVFVDGCFWHNCPEHGTILKNNRAWWLEKFQRNQERDKRKDEQLKEMGWLPIHVWEHEDPDTAARNIKELVKKRLRKGPKTLNRNRA